MQIKTIQLCCSGTKETLHSLDGQSKICNWAYNNAIECANELKQEFKETGNPDIAKILYTKRGLRDRLPSLKKEHPFLKTVHSSPLKNAALRASNAIQAHQKGKKGKRRKESGWPKFRSWQSNWFSLLYDEPNKGFKVIGDTLKLSLGTDLNKKRLFLTLQLKEAHRLKGYWRAVVNCYKKSKLICN